MDINYMKIIEGELLREIGRAADMCWISFGKTIKVKDYRGDEELKGTYALHLQLPWRITDENTENIIIASSDMYEFNNTLRANGKI